MGALSGGADTSEEGAPPIPAGFTGVGVTAVPALDTAGSTVGIGVYPDLYNQKNVQPQIACLAQDLLFLHLHLMITRVTAYADLA